MTSSLYNIILIVIFCLPIGVLIGQYIQLRTNARYLILGCGYALLVANEVLFQAIGGSFFFGHVFIDGLIVSLTVPNIVSPHANKPYYPVVLLFPYAFLFIVMLGAAALVLVTPAKAHTLSLVILIPVGVFSAFILGRSRRRSLLLNVCMLILWLGSHLGAYYGQAVDHAFTIAFFGFMASIIVWHGLHTNQQMFFDNRLLLRSRTAVLSMLNDVASSPDLMSSVESTLRRVLQTITETLSVEAVALYAVEEVSGEEKVLKFVESVGHFFPLYLDDNFVLHSQQLIHDHLVSTKFKMGEGVLGTVAQSGEHFVVDRLNDQSKMNALGLNVRTIRNLMVMPVNISKQLYGVIAVQNSKAGETFDVNDLSLLQFLSDQAGISVSNARMYLALTQTVRLRQEASIAAKIQLRLLPKQVPEPENLRISVFMAPAKEVGGDYYDFLQHADGTTGIVIGDVSGKGVPAGMMMAVAKAIVQIVSQQVHTAKEVVNLFCKEMYTNMESGHFMTLNYLRWDGAKHLLVFAGAGHEYILWFHGKTGRTDKIRVGGLAAGLAADCSQLIVQGELQVEKGDVVVLYTDGVTEAKSASGEMFTLGRLRAALESYAYLLDSAKILELIMKDVNGFMAGCEQYDDITLMVLSVIS